MFSRFLFVSLNSTSIFCFMNITELGTITLFCMECKTPGWIGHPGCICLQAYSLTSPGRPRCFLMFWRSARISALIVVMEQHITSNSFRYAFFHIDSAIFLNWNVRWWIPYLLDSCIKHTMGLCCCYLGPSTFILVVDLWWAYHRRNLTTKSSLTRGIRPITSIGGCLFTKQG